MPARSRTYGGLTQPSPLSYTIYNANGSVNTSGTVAIGHKYGEQGYMHDFVEPHYKSIVANGGIVNNPMSRSSVINSAVTGTVDLRNSNGTKIIYTGDWLGTWTGTPNLCMPDSHSIGDPSSVGLDIGLLWSKASINALKRVTASDTLVGVSIAELQKTVDMIANVSGGLAAAIKAIASGSPKKAVLKLLLGKNYKEPKRQTWATGSKTVASKWLEVRYGWTPLLYDLEGTLAALNAQYQKRFTARGFASQDAATTQSTSTVIDGTFGHSFVHRLDEQWDVKVRAYVLYAVKPEWLKPNKLGGVQPLTTAWELVPFSFVIDWFVDVGDWLDAMTPRIGVKYLAQGLTEEGSYTRTRTCVSTSSGAGSSLSGIVGLNNSHKVRWKTRTNVLNIPPLPPIDVKINVKRAIDSLALFAQQAVRAR